MKTSKIFSILLAVFLLISGVPLSTAYAASQEAAELTFTDSAVTETAAGSGYSISGTALTITAAGIYRINGSCAEGSIEVGKNLSDVTLILEDLSLASSSTAPLVVKKSSNVSIHLEGTTTLTDNENPDNETSSDATVADAFEGAAIKVKSGSAVTFCGDGNLNIVANAKNGIKGGSTASLIFNQSGKITVSGSGKYYGGTVAGAAVNNGIACDGSLVFNQGTYVIKAANDGIKSAPDATDASEGTTIDNDSAGAITINGGTFDIDVDGDGIQADTELTINGGTFDIQTWKGYSVWNDTLADAYSCKGLKASGDRAVEAGLESALYINGGVFNLNTGDDAVHSDAYVTVTGGTFTVSTGDDGMHADTSLTLGTEDGYERDPDVTINSSYEGLEGGTVYIYSGRYYVVASDDGVNAAGGSSNGTDSGNGGDSFNPGGGPSWGPGGNMGWSDPSSSSSGDYNIYIYGGDLYVNCSGDGLDSNGGLYLYGGQQAVFSQARGGDNSAIDADGTVLIEGATIFTAGTSGADGSAQTSWFGSNQKYASSSSSYSASTTVNAKAGSNGSELLSYTLPKAVNYTMVSWPSSVSSSAPSFATASAATSCKGGSWSHSWSSETTKEATAASTGIITYTCADCSSTETQTIPAVTAVDVCQHAAESGEEESAGFTVTFAGDSGVSAIIVYKTQDYSGASETVGADGTAVSRDGDSGTPDSSGSGQINFTVVLNDGYAISDITATSGTYKNIKGPSDTGLANTYRITKITADTTVTITTVECGHTSVEEGTAPVWIWSENCSAATLSYTCGECLNTVEVPGTLVSELTDPSTITFTAKAIIGETEYTDTATAAPYTAQFSSDSGVASVSVYYTQNYTEADEENASSAVARDSDSGCPIVSGDGQINFTVILNDGYTLESVTATSGTYKNIKGPSDTGLANTYRITKITDDMIITVKTSLSDKGLLGDTNSDLNITSIDATLVLQFYANIITESCEGYNNAVADVDGNGVVNSLDATLILQKYAGIIDLFPAEQA